jgi:Protein of unknown function (DUF1153)
METADPKYRQPFALPQCQTTRWVANRKAAVVIAVRDGAISRGIAFERYRLSPEELASWEAAFEQSGTTGLRATGGAIYRDASRPRGMGRGG